MPSRFPAISPPASSALRTSQSVAESERRDADARLGPAAPRGRGEARSRRRRLPGWEDLRRLLDAEVRAVGGRTTALEAELDRLSQPSEQILLTGQQILELENQAGFLYRTQNPAEQRRLPKRCFRTARSTAELFVLLTLSRSTCSREPTKLKIGGERGIRTLGRVSPTHAFQACSFNHSDISPCL